MRTLLTMLVVAIGSFVFLYMGYEGGARTVRAQWDAEKAELASEKSAAIEVQREKEATLQAGMDKLRKEKTDELARLNTTVRRLSDSLRNRPERPDRAAVPASAAVGDGASGCTGATLYRSDSEFLVRFSQRADTIRLALITCQDAYRKASD